LIETVKVDL